MALRVIQSEVCLDSGTSFPVPTLDTTDAKRPNEAVHCAPYNAYDHNRHVAAKDGDYEVAQREVGFNTDNVECEKGVAREQCQHLVDDVLPTIS